MPRPRKPWWHTRDQCYKTRIEGREVLLLTVDGAKVPKGDMGAAWAAVTRLLAERDARTARGLDPTVEDVCSDYLVASKGDCGLDTLYGKEWVLEKWCDFGTPRYGGRRAKSIGPGQLHAMRLSWEAEGYAGNMVRRLYREVMACWAWAARPEPERVPVVLLPLNPLAGMRSPAASTRVAKYVPLHDLQALVGFAAARAVTLGPLRRRFELQAALMLGLLVETGCRPKEACTSTWGDFDADQGVIRLARHKTGKKTGKERLIVVPPPLVAELVTLRDSGYAHPTHIFAHARSRGEASAEAERETGAPWTRPGYTGWFRELVKMAWMGGLELPEGITLYWLRHSYLTDAQMVVSGERAANLAGNSKEVAREAYLHAQLSALRADAERVARGRGG
jgi:integrase